jgi:hypothetical protein
MPSVSFYVNEPVHTNRRKKRCSAKPSSARVHGVRSDGAVGVHDRPALRPHQIHLVQQAGPAARCRAPLGKYVFELPDPIGAWDIVSVMSADRDRVYYMGFTKRIARPNGHPIDQLLSFAEVRPDDAAPIRLWWPIGEQTAASSSTRPINLSSSLSCGTRTRSWRRSAGESAELEATRQPEDALAEVQRLIGVIARGDEVSPLCFDIAM